MGVVDCVADAPEPLELVGRQRVLEEEQAVRLERLRQPDGLDRRQPLVDVVEQLQLGADGAADVVEQLGRSAGVAVGVVVGARERLARDRSRGRRSASATVARSASARRSRPSGSGRARSPLPVRAGRYRALPPARGRRRGDRPSPPRGTCRPAGRRRACPAILPLMSQSAMSTPRDRVVEDRAVAPVACSPSSGARGPRCCAGRGPRSSGSR